MSEPVRVELGDGRVWVVHDRVIYGADAEVAQWVEDRFGGGLVELPFVALGILRLGTDPQSLNDATLPAALIAGTYWYAENSDDGCSDITVSVVADDVEVGNAEVVRRILEYPFGQRRLRRVSAEILLSNERAVRQARKIGFVLEGTKRQAGPGGSDIGLFGLVRDECPFWTRKAGAA